MLAFPHRHDFLNGDGAKPFCYGFFNKQPDSRPIYHLNRVWQRFISVNAILRNLRNPGLFEALDFIGSVKGCIIGYSVV